MTSINNGRRFHYLGVADLIVGNIMWRSLGFLFGILTLFSCTENSVFNSTVKFIELPTSDSGIDFSNSIIENDTLNYFTFPYLYLGGGVSIGDINNDSLPDIYFTGNMVSNKLYLNKGNLQFEDITDRAGVTGDDRWYTGTTMADVNNDGFLDIYVGVSQIFGNSNNQLFINNGDNTFTEAAESYGIADKSTTIQSTFFDYDNDGFLDLFTANYPLVPVSQGNLFYHDLMMGNAIENSGHLYRNSGDGRFTEVTDSAGVRRFGLTLGLVASDFNNDGYKDLYLSNDFNVPDYLYQNNGDGTFSEVSKQATRQTSMFGMGIDAADFNNDGLTDLLQVDMTAADHKRSKTNMASMRPETFYEAIDLGFHYQYMQNSLQLNQGVDTNNKPNFSAISRFSGMATTDWSWGAVFADFDNDGQKDVFISNGVKRDVNNNDVNDEYNDVNPFGAPKKKDFRKLPSTPISNYAFKNNGNFKFSEVTEDWGLDKKGFSNGFACADLDNDGDLDLVINSIDAAASIYVNNAQANTHYIKIALQGKKTNPFALGAKVTVKTSGEEQMSELTLTRGYQSSTEPILHFGIGKNTTVDEIEIVWPNGEIQKIENVAADRQLKIKYDSKRIEEGLVGNRPAEEKLVKISKSTEGYQDVDKSENHARFTAITQALGITFKHREDSYDDFALEPLLPHRYSRLGPGLAVGDINGDGLEDFFIGNAAGSSATMYVQDTTGTFEPFEGPWRADARYEDTGALLFDADQDSDLDLYVVNGGNNPNKPDEFYQDRLYINNENGFEKSENILPAMASSGQEVVAGDYDGDGDLDLFVGGRIIPGKYPFPAQNYILRNDGGKDLALKYTDVTAELAPELQKAGLITSALWDDFDADGKTDLIITGEWMPIRFFRNTSDGFEEKTDNLGLSKNIGWWYGLQKLDVDQDGKMDYIAGNLGLNYKYTASEDNPFEVFANDFDENGTTDIVLSHKSQGIAVPIRGRECSSQQVPAIKKRFGTYAAFADATLTDIYGEKMLESSLHYSANTFASSWLKNTGSGTFEVHPLPDRAQFSSINAMVEIDYNGDDRPDVLTAGNLYGSEVETPRNDAGLGQVLVGTSHGDFKAIAPSDGGLFVHGEVRNIVPIKLGSDKRQAYIFAINNDSLRIIGLNSPVKKGQNPL